MLQFPDAEVDKKAGRRHLVITLGKRNAGIYYSLLLVAMYLWIVGAVVLGYMPYPVLISLLVLPKAIAAIKGALNDYNKFEELIPAQGANVQTVLGVHVLLAVGFLIASVL